MAADSNVLFIRFEPGEEFYDGAGDMPAGHRTMIGNGNDDGRTPDGDYIFNYYNFTEESKKVYFAEIARMVELGPGTGDVKDREVVAPLVYQLYENYPNPFNPTTTIEFSLKKPGQTTIQVFNVVGQLVETLLDERLSEGRHQLHFRADHLSSGVYFYSIKSGDFTEVKKMMLLK
jgi:hypothetical protein